MYSLCTQRLGTDCWWQQVGCTLRPGPEHVCRARAQNPVPRGPNPRYSALLYARGCGVCGVSGAQLPLPRIFQACNICSRRMSVAAWKI